MYTAHVLPVMIASPSDVQEERNLIRTLVNGWNYTDSFRQKVVVLPIGWETHSSPELGISAQDQINQRLVDRCDILVGIFWTKVGSPTKNEASGTVEEVKRHVAAGKPAMLYFSEKPAAPETFDLKQWEARQAFREWCQPQGLYVPFTTIGELREKFERQFRLCIHENPYIQNLLREADVVNGPAEADLTEEPLQTIDLSEEALMLLARAAEGKGIIILSDFLDGAHIQAGVFSIRTEGTGREDAKWRSAVLSLAELGLIRERKYGSGVYFLHNNGYQVVERNADAVRKALANIERGGQEP